MFPKLSQELRTKDYYTLFKIQSIQGHKSSTGQFENSFDFDMKNWYPGVITNIKNEMSISLREVDGHEYLR